MSISILQKAIDNFTSELAATSDSDFGRPTKCDGWDVTALLRHIVGGAVSASMALRGATREENAKFFTDYQFGTDMRADYAAAAADHVKAFSELSDLSTMVQHPVMDMPADRLLMFRIVDFAMHAWDLGTGLGRTVVLDPQVVQYCWDSLSPMAPMLGQTGMFGTGPSGNVPDTADLQTRVLDLSGRRP
jgi:uncharacterized protein (TIGR03086 family)